MKKIVPFLSLMLLACGTPQNDSPRTSPPAAPAPASSEEKLLSKGGFTCYPETITYGELSEAAYYGAKYVRLMKMDGFLLPVSRNYDDSRRREIYQESLQRLKTVLDWAQVLGYEYAIIDWHECPGRVRAEWSGYTDYRIWQEDEEGRFFRNVNLDAMEALAYDLQSYAGFLAIEPMNEASPGWEGSWDNIRSVIWDEPGGLQDQMIARIRLHNKKCLILASPAYADTPNVLDAWQPSPTILKDPNIAVAMHAYFPAEFTQQISKVKYPGNIGGEEWDKGRIEQELEAFDRFQAETSLRLLITEAGVSKEADGAGSWLKDLASALKKRSVGCIFHVIGEDAYWNNHPGRIETKQHERPEGLGSNLGPHTTRRLTVC